MPISFRTKTVLNKLKGAARNAYKRCTDQNHAYYDDYGKRGIEFHFPSVEACVLYLITLQGHDDLSLWIDRIDNNGHYEVGNLRFTTRSVSQKNRRTSRPEHNGESFNGVRYYIKHGFDRCFKRLINKGVSPRMVAQLYGISRQTVSRVIGRHK